MPRPSAQSRCQVAYLAPYLNPPPPGRLRPGILDAAVAAMQHTILAVDDEPEVLSMLQDYLGSKGFRVLTAGGAEEARAILAREPIDLAMLDISMPGEDGLSLARHLREHHASAIIMLTALNSVVDRIVGLEIGADDYVAKPFDLRELLARVKSVLRRTSLAEGEAASLARTSDPERLAIGTCVLDLKAGCLHDGSGTKLPLTSGEFDLLLVFVANPNRVLSRDEILNLTQHRGWEPFDRSVDIRVTRLRRKIEPNPEKPRFIKTIRGVGYMFVPD
jgi:DNA-binding response OmpR family regulator